MSEKLLPCPWCKSNDVLSDDNTDRPWTHLPCAWCNDCHREIHAQDAIDAWNALSRDATKEAEVVRLRDVESKFNEVKRFYAEFQEVHGITLQDGSDALGTFGGMLAEIDRLRKVVEAARCYLNNLDAVELGLRMGDDLRFMSYDPAAFIGDMYLGGQDMALWDASERISKIGLGHKNFSSLLIRALRDALAELDGARP